MRRLLCIVGMLFLLAGCGSVALTSTPTGTTGNSVVPRATAPTIPPSADRLTVEVLDIGQGDSILIRHDQTAVLIDGGRRDSNVIDKLRSRDIQQLDLVVATHPDSDHIGGLVEVMKTLKVKQFAYNGDEHATQTFEDLLDAVDSSGAKYLEPKRGQTLKAGDLDFKVLNPSKTPIDDNNDSLVLRLVYGQRSFLFTGDVEAEGEQSMLDAGVTLRSDVLKVAHHGSDTSSTPAFIKAVDPKIAVYSAGLCNSYGHPVAKTLNTLRSAGAKVYGTDVEGTVTITTDGQSLNVTPQKQGVPAPEEISCKRKGTPAPAAEPTSDQSVSTPPSGGKVKIESVANSGRDEWAVLKNISSATVDLKGWRINAGDSGEKYTLPSYKLAPGKSVKITSGQASGGIHITDKNIWSNDGDTGKLYDPSGKLVSQYEY